MKKLTKIVCGLLLATIAGSSFANANQEIAKNSIYTKFGFSTIDFEEQGINAGVGGTEFGLGYERRIPLNKSVDHSNPTAYTSTKKENHYYIGLRGELGLSNYNNSYLLSKQLGVHEDVKVNVVGNSASLLVGIGSEVYLTNKSDVDYTSISSGKFEYGFYLGVKHTKLTEKAYNNLSTSLTTLVFQPEVSLPLGNHFKIGINGEIGGKSGAWNFFAGGLLGINF